MRPDKEAESWPTTGSTRVLRKREIIDRVGYSLMHLYRLEKLGLFPGRIRLGPNSVGWIEGEVDAWIKERIRQRDQRA